MADTKITALAAITTVDPAADVLPIVDISDTSMAASGTTKKITSNQILGAGGTATLASATITGALTVDTTTLVVNAAGYADRVGIGTASPTVTLDVVGAARFVAAASGPKLSIENAGGSTRFKSTDTSSFYYSAYDHYFTNTDGSVFRYSIDNNGVSTWYVGGTTAMTLNSTGLGVGKVPASSQGKVQIYQALGTSLNGAIHITDDATTSFVLNNTSSGVSSIWTSGALTFSTGSNAYSTNGARMTLDASGNLLVARTGAGLDNTSGVTIGQASIGMQTEGNATQIAMNRTTSDGTIVDIRRNNSTVGTIAVTTAGTTYNTTSDYRLKEAVQPLAGGLARVNALKPSIYKWKSNGSSGEGFIAHELAEVVPAAVTGEKDAVNEDGTVNPQGVDLSKVVPILVAAIQELTARVQTLETR